MRIAMTAAAVLAALAAAPVLAVAQDSADLCRRRIHTRINPAEVDGRKRRTAGEQADRDRSSGNGY